MVLAYIYWIVAGRTKLTTIAIAIVVLRVASSPSQRPLLELCMSFESLHADFSAAAASFLFGF